MPLWADGVVGLRILKTLGEAGAFHRTNHPVSEALPPLVCQGGELLCFAGRTTPSARTLPPLLHQGGELPGCDLYCFLRLSALT